MKIIKPKEIIFQCDICLRKYGKGQKTKINKLNLKGFYEYLFRTPRFHKEEYIICDDCLGEMKKYIRQKVRGSDEE